MKKVFYIDGGAGRVLAAIPAFLKYARLNPDSDFAIIVFGWDFLFWGIPELQDRTYNSDTKGVFDNVVKHCDEVVTPEPYRLPDYFNQKLSLVEAFDRCINNTKDHSDLGVPKMVFNLQETFVAKNTINDVKSSQKKSKTIVIQPFGRGAKVEKDTIYDEESRSISPDDYLKIVNKLSQRYNTIFFGEPAFQMQKDPSSKFTCDLRQWGALIEQADYFVGCDSVGQHMARAVNTKGSIIFGSTYPINTSYPDYFHIIEKQNIKKYSPIRIAGLDVALSNRLNEGSMKFTDKELIDLVNSIISKIESK